MSNYSINPADVRVDFFKPSGKWYTTECVRWTGEWEAKKQGLFDAFKQSLKDHFKGDPNRLSGMTVVCLNPYHEYSHPIMLYADDWN